MSCHASGFMNMGNGGVHVHSNNKKSNTKSSTEAKIVEVDDVLT